MKVKDQVSNDPRVTSVWDKSGSDDGYWVNLKPGFADLTDDPWQPTHTIHEWKWSDIRRRMRNVKPCQCKECVEATTKPQTTGIESSMVNS